ELIEDWRERLEEGIRRQPLAERTGLLERLLIAHESYDEIMAAWAEEVRRRLAEMDAGLTEFIPGEDVLAELRASVADAEKDWQPPPVPEDIEDIEEEALHLGHDDFYTLLVSVEAELPPDVDPTWRADIRTRIQAVPVQIARRYREQEERGGYSEDPALLNNTPDVP
ncbi:MAG TPA: addiction module protein, partial [Longimicrobium sp.]|nr:addiction module protein [Longimicrobium sp.]